MESARPQAAFAFDEQVASDLNKLSTIPMSTKSHLGWIFLTSFLARSTEKIMKRIAEPAIRGFKEKTGNEYVGVIYFGLMISQERDPYVLEINVRLGDPEAEVTCPPEDHYQLSEAMLDAKLNEVKLEWSPEHCLGICAVSGRAIKSLSSGGGGERPGYPGEHYTNMPISGWELVDPDILVYHNGTAWGTDASGKKRLFTTGGRVLTLVARGNTLGEARTRAYDNIKRIRFNGMRYRKDIGLGYV
jgi:phosphoribosylamine--glycine ligase